MFNTTIYKFKPIFQIGFYSPKELIPITTENIHCESPDRRLNPHAHEVKKVYQHIESALFGIYNKTVDELYYPYIRPQENGYRTELRWLKIGNGDTGFMVTSDLPFSFGAQRFEKEDYEFLENPVGRTNILNQLDMKPRDYVVLNLDYGQMGVGGDNSWGYTPHKIYQFIRREYRFSYSIIPMQ